VTEEKIKHERLKGLSSTDISVPDPSNLGQDRERASGRPIDDKASSSFPTARHKQQGISLRKVHPIIVRGQVSSGQVIRRA
jgi:hypothetical protein